MHRRMPGDLCVVCGNYRKHNPQPLFHRFPSDLAKRSQWVRVFELDPEAVKPHHRVCSQHFLTAILKMVHSCILEGDLLLLLKREATGALGPLEDSKFRSYKSYSPLVVQNVLALVTPQAAQLRRIPLAFLSYLQVMMVNRQHMDQNQ